MNEIRNSIEDKQSNSMVDSKCSERKEAKNCYPRRKISQHFKILTGNPPEITDKPI